MKTLVIYVNGKGGNTEEAKHYQSVFKESDIIGLDYKSQTPWEAKIEFPRLYDGYCKSYDSVILIANSIGAYLSMNALAEKNISQAFLISPVTDMEKLIADMMKRANITEDELRNKKEIETEFGETLSWEYLSYVKNHPIKWNIPTSVLYGEKDNLTSKETITKFAEQIGANLTIMENGEHWFHTDEQLNFLDNWLRNSTQ
ncbi:alpha/beta hydrolase [Streptococcus suis]|uniref:serine aminopeptidase domain-containing protein n=1 Tax=Streptococcus parasuis TaxID=1501662 RepID=UPI001551CDE8|nr:alpha/beta hydrolase [Streptococcus suis]WNF85586.1 alpha/beta hydrolase [Streptococcus parasuis]